MIASVLTLTACRRNKDTTTPALTNADDNGGYASDAARLDQNSNDIISIADAAAATGGSNLRVTATTLGGCATVTHDTTSATRVITVDFGSGTCTSLDGKVRSGKIIITYTGRYKDSGSVHIITTNNYFVNGRKVIVHKTVTNEGTNSSGQVWYSVTVNDSIVLRTDSIISWTGTRTRTWLAGYSTPDRSDDVYAIGGVTTVKRANGNVFVHTISATDPLKVALACSWIEDGTVTITSSHTAYTTARILDYGYGGGGCDNQAQLTIGSRTYVITMY